MRHLTIPLLLFLPLLHGCRNLDCVEAPGPAVSRELTLEAIKGVITEGSIDVEVVQGPVQQVRAEGPAAAMDLLNTRVKDGIWHVRTDRCFDGDVDLVVHITLPALERVGVAGSGDVRATGNFAGDRLEVTVAGSGDITMPLSARELEVSILGSGDVNLSGTAGQARVRITGSGAVNGLELSAGRAKVEIMGSGDAGLTVVDALEAEILGSGGVNYRGTPKVSTSISGSGAVVPVP
ncbi:MAG: DUF2807 domain-containing protein [Flavobacteriales bacterium]|nr:hypothetical protein [Flavobacteriales bacterium]MCC6575712.1 DUF2807 domain-containing protein [Flavobacteriales bacterium]NUQ14454.1 DUF2807 domain-containing protein [Flavobacteriales bacterium]